MCHGDLTPITLTYDTANDWIKPNFAIKHTCRNFDSIWEFSAGRNRTGISIEGA
jgi:Mycotoxin biosynthesis protein UstYa